MNDVFRIPGILIIATALLVIPQTPIAAEPDQAARLAERMLERLGGRDTWSALRNTVNGSRQNRSEHPTDVYSIITMDFESPRFRIDTIAKDINLVRVINGQESWRISWAGVVEDLPRERFADDMRWYQAHLYRTIHRIASHDPALSLRSSEAGLLEVYDRDDRLLWLRLDADGEPYAFGFYEDDKGSLSGPWNIIRHGIRHPSWVSSADGTWRAAVQALEVNVKLLPNTFARPPATSTSLTSVRSLN